MSATNDAHGRPSGAPLAFSPPDVAAPSHAERVCTLLASRATGVLCTLATDPPGHPYGSYVTYAMDAGRPVFLISRIAEHTQNLRADSRASLVVHEEGKADPLANARVTVVGTMERLPREPGGSPRASFLERHPQSAYYVDFADFDFHALAVESVRYIGGYGRMSWVPRADYAQASPDPLASAAAGMLEHMNADHADALVLYARAFTEATDATAAHMTAIDRYGFEMSVDTPRGRGPARIAFSSPLRTQDTARAALVSLVRQARERLGG